MQQEKALLVPGLKPLHEGLLLIQAYYYNFCRRTPGYNHRGQNAQRNRILVTRTHL